MHQEILVKQPNIIFSENQFSCSGVATCIQMDDEQRNFNRHSARLWMHIETLYGTWNISERQKT
jgi:hypothetical protein